MTELEHFYNRGFGWVCRSCEAELNAASPPDKSAMPRLMREGEAESKNPRFSNDALAQWTDAERNTLQCPRCNLRESLNSA